MLLRDRNFKKNWATRRQSIIYNNFVAGLLLLLVTVLQSNARAAEAQGLLSYLSLPQEIRSLTSVGRIDDINQLGFAYSLNGPSILGAQRWELATGVFSSPANTRAYVSLGPVWRFSFRRAPSSFLEFGFSPTYIAGSTFGDRDLGGNLQFTSSVAVGKKFGLEEKWSLSLRAQHTSNGGLDELNPGLDMIGLNIQYRFGLGF
ncbi:MAG: acyloxyacyl hydrolase [Pseudomonadota bacterium]